MRTKSDDSGSNELVITRLFDAPRSVVWQAWTEPKRIKEWWGPKGFSAPIIETNFRRGGSYLYSMKEDASGKMYWSGGEFLDIVPQRKLVISDHFSDEHGNTLDPEDYGMDPNFPIESKVTVKFDEEGSKTRLSIIYKLPKSKAAREAIEKSRMDEGWSSSLDKLEESLGREMKAKKDSILAIDRQARAMMKA